MTPIAQLIAQAGLPATTEIKALPKLLPGLTWHVTHPLANAEPPITTVGDLAERSDDDLLAIPLFGAGRLARLKAALAQHAATAGNTTTAPGPACACPDQYKQFPMDPPHDPYACPLGRVQVFTLPTPEGQR